MKTKKHCMEESHERNAKWKSSDTHTQTTMHDGSYIKPQTKLIYCDGNQTGSYL